VGGRGKNEVIVLPCSLERTNGMEREGNDVVVKLDSVYSSLFPFSNYAMFDYYLDIITFSSPLLFFSLAIPEAINPLDRISIISWRKIPLSILAPKQIKMASEKKTSLTRVILYKKGGGVLNDLSEERES
jgi:hypothetical protein